MEETFIFNLPTKVYFGKDKEKEIGNILKELNVKKVLLVYGQSSAIKSGLIETIKRSLKDTDIISFDFSGIRVNPTIQKVKEGISLAKEKDVDFILAIGGGSVIDSAKLIGIGMKSEDDPFLYSLHKKAPTSRVDFGVILTISASGSEMSNSCVVQNDLTGEKLGFTSELNRPVFVIENPYLTQSVGKKQTAIGIVDMFSHTMERYFCKSSLLEPADRISEAVMRGIIESAKVIMKDLNNIEARSNLMIYSSLAHNGITSIGKSYRLTVHQLEHVVSGLYPCIYHGECLGVLLPAWMEQYYLLDIDKFDSFSRNVLDLHFQDKKKNAKMGITVLREFFQSLGLPSTLTELGVKSSDIDLLVNRLTHDGTRTVGHHIKPIDKEIAKKIFVSVI